MAFFGPCCFQSSFQQGLSCRSRSRLYRVSQLWWEQPGTELVDMSGVVHPASRDAVWVYRLGYRADRLAIGEIGRVLRDRRQGKRVTAGVGVVQFELFVDQIDVCPAGIDLSGCRASHDPWNGNGRQCSQDQNNDHQLHKCKTSAL